MKPAFFKEWLVENLTMMGATALAFGLSSLWESVLGVPLPYGCGVLAGIALVTVILIVND